MLVIADGGSTKVDWHFVKTKNEIHQAHSIGFNPYYFGTKKIVAELSKNFIKENPVKEVKKLFFYGAGCSNEKKCAKLSDAFHIIFPNADIQVTHDLMAAARASCGHTAGIACILGTGSNSCLYDGSKIIDNIPTLGFFLGDEGSGAHIGKALIRAYYYRELPVDLKIKLEKFTNMDRAKLLQKIYGNSPNVFLASFSTFIGKNKHHVFLHHLVKDSFAKFIDKHIRKYNEHTKLPIHFVGSIAHYYKDILKEAMAEKNLHLGNIIQQPIQHLVAFHLNS